MTMRQFIEMSGAGLKESHPHDVQITNESTKLFNVIKKSPVKREIFLFYIDVNFNLQLIDHYLL